MVVRTHKICHVLVVITAALVRGFKKGWNVLPDGRLAFVLYNAYEGHPEPGKTPLAVAKENEAYWKALAAVLKMGIAHHMIVSVDHYTQGHPVKFSKDHAIADDVTYIVTNFHPREQDCLIKSAGHEKSHRILTGNIGKTIEAELRQYKLFGFVQVRPKRPRHHKKVRHK